MEPAEQNVIPLNWRSLRIRHLLNDYFGGSWGDEPDEREVENFVRVIRVTEFDMTRLRVSDNIPTIRSLALDENSVAYVRQGDIILEKSGGGEKTPVGRAVVMTDPPAAPTINSNFTNLLRPKPSVIQSRFLIYALYSSYHIGQTKRNIKQTTGIQNLDISGFVDERLLVPPLHEQQLISRYLDKETAQIDSLIEKIEKKIELLKEQRISLINQCVTKGLDPNVEMKDSGVEWIGRIPKHWRLSKIKWVTSKIGSGITPRGGSEVYSETGVPFLRSQNIHFDGLRLEDVVYISDEIDESMSGSRVQRNDILFNITGGSIGRCCLVRSDARMNVNQHVCIVRPNSEIVPEFLLTVLSSELGQSQLHMNLTGSGREGLNFENLGNFLIPVMDIEEQVEIGNRVSNLNSQFFKLNDKLTTMIVRLVEYRQSLISSVVTGKIRVTEDMV